MKNEREKSDSSIVAKRPRTNRKSKRSILGLRGGVGGANGRGRCYAAGVILSMYRLGIAFFLVFMLAAASASAWEDMIAPLAKVDKEYAAPKPLGRLRVTYSGPERGNEPGLAVECELFRGSVPVKGLADLPRPDWERFVAAYSLTDLTSFESGKWTGRPYVYVRSSPARPCGQGCLAAYMGDVSLRR